jgi:two-component system cell cycle response regulator
MPKRGSTVRPPVVLIIDDQEWSTRSLESVLAPSGYAVMRAYNAASGLERAGTQPLDAVFIGAILPDGDGVRLCGDLRSLRQISETIPILLMSSERPTRQQRVEAMEAGAWEFLSYPIDAQELVLRLDAYMRAKFEADRAKEMCLMDEATGLYNMRGLEQRAAELRSHAYRGHEAMACVVIGPRRDVGRLAGIDGDEGPVLALAEKMGTALGRVGRVSDAIGRLGLSEFAVVAPATDAEAAVSLAERLAVALASVADESSLADLQLRAGYDAVADMRETPIEPKDLLLHATLALRRARSNGNGSWVVPYQERDREGAGGGGN